MENQSPHLSLRVPTPTQQNLSFCDATPKDIKYWLAHLPKANLGETARQLYQGLIELNQLVLPVEARLQLLELFRPEVHFVCAHLERHFLNQAIVLDERPRKIANLCQALQNHLAIGYKLIVVQEAPRNSRDRAQLFAVGIQRAIRSLCGPLIRASQLYCPVPEGLWLELHQLYQLASQRGVHRLAVRDELAKHTPGLSVEQAYLIPLLLGCARCNQMRQNNIARLAEVLEPWSQLLSIQSATLPGSLFIAVPQIDGPPRYRSLYPETQLASALGIDTQPLVELIREYLLQPEAERAKARLPLIEGVTLDLLQHLSSAWGDIAERTFQRTQGQGQLTLCIGMSALHYFLAGRRPFNEVLQIQEAPEAPRFKADVQDAWAGAFDAQKVTDWQPGMPLEEIEYRPHQSPRSVQPGHPQAHAQADATEDYPTYALPIVNHSPGGYCLSWPKEVPAQLQAGELVGLQDLPGQAWSIAVVPGTQWRHADGHRDDRPGGTALRPATAAQDRAEQPLPARPAAAGDRRDLAAGDGDHPAPAVPGGQPGADQPARRGAARGAESPAGLDRQLQPVRIPLGGTGEHPER